MMYYYILGFGIACLVLFGIGSMETVCVKPAEMLVKALLWPVTLMEAVVNYSSNTPRQDGLKDMQGCCTRKGAAAFLFGIFRKPWYNKGQKAPTGPPEPTDNKGEL